MLFILDTCLSWLQYKPYVNFLYSESDGFGSCGVWSCSGSSAGFEGVDVDDMGWLVVAGDLGGRDDWWVGKAISSVGFDGSLVCFACAALD